MEAYVGFLERRFWQGNTGRKINIAMLSPPKHAVCPRCKIQSKISGLIATLLVSVLLLAYVKTSSHIKSIMKHHEIFKENNFYFDQHSTNNTYYEDNIIPSFPLVREYETSLGKYDNEKARPLGFDLSKDKTTTSQTVPLKIIYLATAYFKQWNPKHYYFLHFGQETFKRYSCPVVNCYVTNDPSQISTAHAVLFHVRDLELFSFPYYRSSNQTWILYSMESPWLEITDLGRYDGLFNWTMSYRRQSDIQVKYGFIGRRPSVKPKQYSEKTFKQKMNKAVWYVSNCNTDSNREEYVRRLRAIYPVEVFGGCGTEACRPAESKTCYLLLQKRYKFYLAFENSICQDYVTEKLFNALEYFIIPVTFGGVNYRDIVPPNSIVNAMEFSSPEDLGRFLLKVSSNETLYLSYFKWKKYYRSYLQPWMCDLCSKLHEPLVSKTNYDLKNWWHENGTCLRFTNGTFQKVQQYAIPQYHTKIFKN